MKLSLSFLYCTLSAALVAAPVYSITDLGSMGGSSAAGYSINGHGEAVGVAVDVFGIQNAFEGAVNGSAPFARNAAAWAINDAGQIAGIQYSDGNSYAMFWSNTGNRLLGGAGSAALGINESGQVTGMTGNGHVFLTGEDGGGVRDLGKLAGGSWSAGYAVNESGQVAGYGIVGSNYRAFRFDEGGGGFQTLGTLGGRNSYGMAINDSGWVVGSSQNQFGYLRATLWTHNRTVDLGTLDHGLSSYAYGINQWGAAVGYSQTASGEYHAFLWQDGVLYDLNLLLGDGSGWSLNYAFGINDDGQIVGEGTYNGLSHAFKLDLRKIVSGANGIGANIAGYSEDSRVGGGEDVVGVMGASVAAVPEPSTWAMVLTGLILCALGGGRKKVKLTASR